MTWSARYSSSVAGTKLLLCLPSKGVHLRLPFRQSFAGWRSICRQCPSRSVQWRFRARRKNDYEYAQLDDEPPEPTFSLDNLPKTSGYIFKILQNFTERFVDLAYDIAPEGVSRPVVETTTKGALVLVTLAFASSILTFLLNAGFVALGLYVASKVFNIDIGGAFTKNNGSALPPPQADTSRRKTSKRASRQKRRPENEDVSDVWFERPPRRKGSQ